MSPDTILGQIESAELEESNTISTISSNAFPDEGERQQRRELLRTQLQISTEGHTEEEVTSLRRCMLEAEEVLYMHVSLCP